MGSHEYETDFSSLEPESQQPAAETPVTEVVEETAPVTEVTEEAAPEAEATEETASEAEATEEVTPAEEPEDAAYTPARKVSPFADSPYVTCAPIQPAKAAAPRKKRSVNWLSAITILLVIVLSVSFAIFFVSANAQNTALNNQIASLQQQIKDLKDEIKKNSYTGNGNSVSGTDNTNLHDCSS